MELQKDGGKEEFDNKDHQRLKKGYLVFVVLIANSNEVGCRRVEGKEIDHAKGVTENKNGHEEE